MQPRDPIDHDDDNAQPKPLGPILSQATPSGAVMGLDLASGPDMTAVTYDDYQGYLRRVYADAFRLPVDMDAITRLARVMGRDDRAATFLAVNPDAPDVWWREQVTTEHDSPAIEWQARRSAPAWERIYFRRHPLAPWVMYQDPAATPGGGATKDENMPINEVERATAEASNSLPRRAWRAFLTPGPSPLETMAIAFIVVVVTWKFGYGPAIALAVALAYACQWNDKREG